MKQFILQDHLRGGGTERQSIALTEALNQAELPTTLLVGSRGGKLDTLAERALGPHLNYLSEGESLNSIKALWKLHRLSSRGPCLIVCMGRWAHMIMGLLPTAASRKVVSTVRTSRDLPYLYKKTIRSSHYLVANSAWALDYTQQVLGQTQLPESVVIHNGLSRTELLEIKAENRVLARSRLGIDPSATVLLNVARLEGGKGQAELIRATALLKHPGTHLWLLGEGPELQALESLARALKLKDRVHFLGFQESLSDYYAAADICLSASTLDSLPNALLEAHAAGLPIIAYPTAGIPEIVDHSKTGLLTKASTPEAMLACLEQLINAKDTCAQMGACGRAKIMTQFDRRQQNSRFCQLIAELIRQD